MITDIVVKVMVELLTVLALTTKEIKQGRFSEFTVTHTLPVLSVTEKFMKMLWGKDSMQAVLERLDRLTKDEGLSVGAQTLGVVHGLAENMKMVIGAILPCFLMNICLNSYSIRWKGAIGCRPTEFGYVSSRATGITVVDLTSTSIKQDETFGVFSTLKGCQYRLCLVGDQLQRDVRYWLSPPDPSTNHNFVSEARHSGTAAWFLESKAMAEWKATGSFLWIHGKRMFFFGPSMNALH
jgi:hypothetical protein